MNRKTIIAIITIMSIALIGLIIIQFVWIKWQVDLDAKNFDNKVVLALNTVSLRLTDEAQNQGYIRRNSPSLFGKKNSDLVGDIMSSSKERWIRQKREYEISSLAQFSDPNSSLEGINKNNLDTYLKQELENQDIELNYQYGVYSNEFEDFIILNGNYVATVKGESSQTDLENNPLTRNAVYQVALFNDEEGSPGSLRVFFPGKTSWLWSSVMPSMLASLFFTGLVLFCFIYTIMVILRQKKVSEMKTDFINNMTHEFKTPIATISLAADSMVSPMVSGHEEKVKRFAKIIKQENSRMLNQVEKVLQMAKIDKQEFELKKIELDMHKIILQAAENIQLKVAQRKGSVTTELKAEDPILYGDKTHLSNIIHNLLDNAEKYSQSAPQINIETKSDAKGLWISVSDQGIGMSKDSLKNIFDKFYRVHTGNIHDVKGFGLGLSYVKALVDAHEGTVSVKSELGKGSTFTIFLPKNVKI